MDKVVIYIHGKGGNVSEADFYKNIFKDFDVIGLNYESQTPWEAKEEFTRLMNNILEKYDSAIVVANSIGAYFLMNAIINKKVKSVFFISPIVDMRKLIEDMMVWANVSEEELKEKQIIKTSFGEDLSWQYYTYAKENKIEWNVETHILYGSKDNLTTLETITKFVKEHDATLTVMEEGEHWFHTDEQMKYIKEWIESFIE